MAPPSDNSAECEVGPVLRSLNDVEAAETHRQIK